MDLVIHCLQHDEERSVYLGSTGLQLGRKWLVQVPLRVFCSQSIMGANSQEGIYRQKQHEKESQQKEVWRGYLGMVSLQRHIIIKMSWTFNSNVTISEIGEINSSRVYDGSLISSLSNYGVTGSYQSLPYQTVWWHKPVCNSCKKSNYYFKEFVVSA